MRKGKKIGWSLADANIKYLYLVWFTPNIPTIFGSIGHCLLTMLISFILSTETFNKMQNSLLFIFMFIGTPTWFEQTANAFINVNDPSFGKDQTKCGRMYDIGQFYSCASFFFIPLFMFALLSLHIGWSLVTWLRLNSNTQSKSHKWTNGFDFNSPNKFISSTKIR